MSRKKKHSGGHPARRARTRPLSRTNQRRMILTNFAQWFEQKSPEDESPTGEEIATVLDAIWTGKEVNGLGLSLTNPDPEALKDLLDLFSTMTEDDEDDAFYPVVFTAHEYLHFLDERRLWSGTAVDLDDCLEITHAFLSDFDSPADLLGTLPGVAVETRRLSIESLTIVRAVRELLDWIGASRQITASGVLRLADIERAASLLGVAAVGRSSPRPGLLMLDLDMDLDVPSRTDEPLQVASMRDVPELDAWWHALLTLQIIETTSTTVRPGPEAGSWLTADPDEALDLGEGLVGAYLAGVFRHELEARTGMHFLAIPIANDLLANLITALRPDVEAEKPSVELFASPFPEMFGLRTRSTMQQLECLGLIEIRAAGTDVRYITPEGLRPAFAAVLPSIGEQLLGADDGEYDPPGS